uniref:Uncharacterized protein n=1 Tax=Monopterus albus TaxID=43700 RepID=A0A3Q3J2R9_MONAL
TYNMGLLIVIICPTHQDVVLDWRSYILNFSAGRATFCCVHVHRQPEREALKDSWIKTIIINELSRNNIKLFAAEPIDTFIQVRKISSCLCCLFDLTWDEKKNTFLKGLGLWTSFNEK